MDFKIGRVCPSCTEAIREGNALRLPTKLLDLCDTFFSLQKFGNVLSSQLLLINKISSSV